MIRCQPIVLWDACIRKKYCEGDKTLCARYMVASSIGKENVPANLFPIMTEEANEIIHTYKVQNNN